MTLLTTRDLSVSIGGQSICRELTFELRPAECWALLGANGAGKTTLLHTLAGLRRPDAGAVLVQGQPLGGWSLTALARFRGVLFQDSQDTFPASVMETVLTGRHPYLHFWEFERDSDYELARRALQEVGLETLADRRVDTLSGGERRRLALATLRVQAPQLLLLDEPTNHLDLRYQVELLEQLSERVRSESGGLLMSLHDVNLAQRFCSHVVLMFGDGAVCTGPVNNTLSEATVGRLYGHPVHAVKDAGLTLYWPD